MSAKAKYFKIGVFLVTGLVLGVVGIVVLGAGSLFEKKLIMETYFDESVQGLDVGAAVKNRGVKVGTVKKIDFVENAYRSELSPEDLVRFGHYVVVRVAVHNEFPGMSGEEIESVLKAATDRGLRIRLATQGVTGVVHLEADQLDSDKYPPMPITWKPAHFYVPSAPSTIKVVGDTLSTIAGDLAQANIHKVAEDLDTLLLTVTKLVDETHMAQLSRQAGATLTELQSTLKETRGLLESAEIKSVLSDAALAAGGARRMVVDLTQTTKRINQASETVPDSVARLEKSIRRLDQLIAMRGQDMDQTIDNLRQISDNLRMLTDNAKRYPSQVVFGEPPPRRDRSAKP